MTDAPRIGLALGGGAARGWAHIGVIRGLEAQGIRPDLIAGTSVGAVVGAMACNGHFDDFETWVRQLTRRDVLAHMDFALGNGGFIQGGRLLERFRETFGLKTFKDLQTPLGVVATSLYTGQERWLREDDVVTAVRASMALPGMFTPVHHEGEWLVDGGLVNPVPVSLCHAMGADFVIAVNLSDGLIGRHFSEHQHPPAVSDDSDTDDTKSWIERLSTGFKEGFRDGADLLQKQFERGDHETSPGVFDVIASSITIMQDRITRSRMAGDPPDVLITPQLAHIGLLELHRGAETIKEGQEAVERIEPALEAFKQRL
ncbi:MAG: patatin-like phospholipase family protein [Gammaproteobacteria bacterium]|nr:patatin-like phospholipase family protein [Gammaproteobacteria bacterium]